MKFRIEFTKPGPGATAFKWVLHLAKKFPSFKESSDGDLPLYSLEFTEKELGSMVALFNMMRGWKGHAIFIDDTLVSHDDFWTIVYDIQRKKRGPNPTTINDLIEEIEQDKNSPKIKFNRTAGEFTVDFPHTEEQDEETKE